jgi:hypothetical protein
MATQREFVFVSDFDNNGVLGLLATNGNTEDYTDPHTAGRIIMTTSGIGASTLQGFMSHNASTSPRAAAVLCKYCGQNGVPTPQGTCPHCMNPMRSQKNRATDRGGVDRFLQGRQLNMPQNAPFGLTTNVPNSFVAWQLPAPLVATKYTLCREDQQVCDPPPPHTHARHTHHNTTQHARTRTHARTRVIPQHADAMLRVPLRLCTHVHT